MNQGQSYYVLDIYPAGQQPKRLTFSQQRVVIGRDGGDIALGDGQASAMHAEIEFDSGQLVVRDLGSSNGTWKGDQALPQFAISEGQDFRVGHSTIKVVQVVGGRQLKGGATVMGDANMLAALKAQRQAASGAAPVAAPPPQAQSSGGGKGVIIALAVVLAVVVVGGGGFAAWMLTRSGDEAVVAEAEEEEEAPEEDKEEDKEPEPEPTAATATDGDVEDEPVVEKDMGELYRQVGASTVVIRVPGSVGSGAVIDPSGLILTNNHVIDGGERDGLQVKAKVVLGAFNDETAAFEPAGEAMDAHVLKVDVDHDLALIKLAEPPENLAALKFSTELPYPGQKVAAVGHAGAGMLWAIKGGEISATGALSGHANLQLEESKGTEREALARIKEQIDKQGRVIQSTAKILPGDSGGPLVNLKSEIVGVNAFGRIDRATGQWLSFHVHLAEVQEFIKDVPDKPLDLLPDPWKLAGVEPRFADVDLDGVSETLVAAPKGSKDIGFFLDLDQDSLPKGSKLPTWNELSDTSKLPFDAELIVLAQGGKRHYFYDTDNDGKHDLYMHDDGGGKVTEAYKLATDGGAERDDKLIITDGLDSKPFGSSVVRDRLRSIGPVVFPGAVERGASGSGVPDILGAAFGEISPRDADGDGTAEAFLETTLFHRRLLLDLDQNVGATTGPAFKRLLDGNKPDVEVGLISQAPLGWIWYDTDDDGKFDLLLETFSQSTGVTQKAFAVGRTGSLSKIEGHVGRLLVRPDLLSGDSAQRLAKVGSGMLGAGAFATSGGLGTFPSTKVSAQASVTMLDAPDAKHAVAVVTQQGRDLILIDVDRNSIKGKKSAADAAKVVRSGKFDPEFALLRHGGMAWAYYDTDNKKGFDLVIVAAEAGRSDPTHAYTINGDEVADTATGSSLIQFGRFTSAPLRKKFEKVSTALFPREAREK